MGEKENILHGCFEMREIVGGCFGILPWEGHSERDGIAQRFEGKFVLEKNIYLRYC